MLNNTIKLPKELHSVMGTQPKINFEMSYWHYKINGVQYDNELKDKLTSGFKGFLYTIHNKSITVTLFYVDDILQNI